MALDYYNILGLKPNADAAAIKKSFRELAHRYHPDVNHSPDAPQKFRTINEAYHVLSDPDRRSAYDAERLLHSVTTARQSAPSPERHATQPTPGSDRTNGPASTDPAGRSGTPHASNRVEFDGFGTVPTGGFKPHAPRPAPDVAAARAKKVRENAERAKAFLEEAQLSFINRRYKDAEEYCKEVLQLDRHNATAHEILGDVYAKRGQRESAAMAYTYAIQFNPQNLSVQAKLDRLNGLHSDGGAAGIRMTRPVPVSRWDNILAGPNRERVLNAMSALALLIVGGELALLLKYPGAPLLGDLSANVVGSLGLTGLLAGLLLAFFGGMRPLSQELAPRPSLTRAPLNLSLLLSVFALCWFYLSLFVYIIIALTQRRTSYSVLRAYGVTILLSVVYVFLYNPHGAPFATAQAALFSGNILFPTILLGWRIGDGLRLRS